MLPILAAIGVSMLSTLAGKAVTAVVEGTLGGRAMDGVGKRSFDTILERSQATKSNRAPAQGSHTLPAYRPASTFADGSANDASVGLLTAQLATQRTLTPLNAVLATARRPGSPRVVEDLIGRKIAANGSAFDVRGAVPTILQYRLPTAAASVQIEVRDLRGTVVRTIQLGPQPGGLHKLPFDGRGLSSGLHLYRVIAADAAGQPLARVSTASGRVMGVQFESGQPFLNVGSALVPLTGIFDVSSLQPSAFSA